MLRIQARILRTRGSCLGNAVQEPDFATGISRIVAPVALAERPMLQPAASSVHYLVPCSSWCWVLVHILLAKCRRPDGYVSRGYRQCFCLTTLVSPCSYSRPERTDSNSLSASKADCYSWISCAHAVEGFGIVRGLSARKICF